MRRTPLNADHTRPHGSDGTPLDLESMALGKRLVIETGLLARRMAGEGCTVEVERQITVY